MKDDSRRQSTINRLTGHLRYIFNKFKEQSCASLNFSTKMRQFQIACSVLGLLVATEAGILSPLFLPSNILYPIELRKAVYHTKPIFKPELINGVQYYKFPVVQSQVPAASPLHFVPTVKVSSGLVANARAVSDAGLADSSVVSSDDGTPYSVVANAGPGAAYSSAVLHPGGIDAPISAQAEVSKGSH